MVVEGVHAFHMVNHAIEALQVFVQCVAGDQNAVCGHYSVTFIATSVVRPMTRKPRVFDSWFNTSTHSCVLPRGATETTVDL